MYYFLIFLFIAFVLALFFFLYLKIAKKTSDLEERNKRLSALREIDEVMISSSKGLIDVAQKVTDAVAFRLGFEVGVLALVDEPNGVLKRVAMSNTPAGLVAKKALPFPYEQLDIPLNCNENITIRALKTNKYQVSHDLHEVFVPALDVNLSHKIQETVGTKTSLIYPINARGKTIGVMIISIGRSEEQLSVYELESIKNIVDVIGVALDNAILYQNLEDTTEQLAQANERLKELDHLKDDFMAVASHELRTPMTAIKSYLWMAINRPDIKLSEKMSKYISRAFVSTERLINLVNDMLNVSRIEAGRIDVRPEILDIQSLAADVVAEVSSKAAEKMINLRVLKNNPPKVFADPDKVTQVLMNLLGNSLKFTPVDGVITLNFFSDGRVVDISVRDNGVGISQDDLSGLFKKFGRLDNSYVAAATAGGTGLGLYIAKSLVELMGGKIWASSEGLGKGATFTFSLPIAAPEIIAQEAKFTKKAVGEAKTLEPVAI